MNRTISHDVEHGWGRAHHEPKFERVDQTDAIRLRRAPHTQLRRVGGRWLTAQQIDALQEARKVRTRQPVPRRREAA
jgi:hypothetical protein